MLFGNAYSCVGNLNARMVVVICYDNANLSIYFVVSYSVVTEIINQLVNLIFVTVNYSRYSLNTNRNTVLFALERKSSTTSFATLIRSTGAKLSSDKLSSS